MPGKINKVDEAVNAIRSKKETIFEGPQQYKSIKDLIKTDKL
ncbi:hypothetical protein [Flammeovirga kamogawensis]|nr:hypothetical protein [Flammeovirga kamogawensis]MBB6463607.1 hypothetical protein [Flammeovirga kamogawensis]